MGVSMNPSAPSKQWKNGNKNAVFVALSKIHQKDGFKKSVVCFCENKTRFLFVFFVETWGILKPTKFGLFKKVSSKEPGKPRANFLEILGRDWTVLF